MNYDQATRKYNSRLKSRDYKIFYRYFALMLREDGVFEYCGSTWVQDADTKKAKRIANPRRLFATLDQNDVLTWVKEDASYKGDRNLFEQMTGFGSATSNTSKYAAYENKIRFQARDIDVPLVKGLAINVKTRTVVASTPDVKRTTNKEASKPIIKYVQAVMKVMDVLHRIGELEEVTTHQDWRKRKVALNDARVTDMTEETMALLAQSAYTEAEAITGGPAKYTYITDQTLPLNQYGNYPTKRIDYPEHVWKAEHYKKVRANASKRLRTYLKEYHGGYDKETSTTTKGI